ncbi:MAG: hypothetical protein J6K92_03915 [Oscillospiraceae bacterium]|nr:hypothetical protein [Oscillospiraceae bacterium]
MNKIDIFSYGWIYDAILAMLFIVAAIDFFGIIRSIRAGGEELSEYAALCVKYLKIAMLIFAGGFFLIVAFTYGYDTATTLIHGFMGFLLIADAIVSLVIKLKFSKRYVNK